MLEQERKLTIIQIETKYKLYYHQKYGIPKTNTEKILYLKRKRNVLLNNKKLKEVWKCMEKNQCL